MAHSSLKASQILGSDAAMNCDICMEEELVEAEAYCMVCNQYLCKQCRIFHQRVNVTKSHQLFIGEDLPKANASYRRHLEHSSTPVETIKCHEHRGEDVEYFCEMHDSPCCRKCTRIEHRNCKTEPLCNLARKHAVCAANQTTLKHVKDMHGEIKRLLTSNESEMETFTGEKNDVVDAINSQRKKIDEVVDQWEQKLLEVVDRSFEEKSKQLHDHNNVLSDIENTSNEKSIKLDMAVQSLDEEAVVVASEARKDMKKYKSMLSEIQGEKCDVKVEIHTNDPSRKLAECLKSTNQLFITKQWTEERSERIFPEVAEAGNRMYIDRMAVEHGSIYVESTSDKEVPGITGIEILQDGRIIMCDIFNLKLKLYDANFNFLCEKALPSSPWRMSLTNVFGEVVVTLEDRSLLFASVDSTGTLSVGQQIMLDSMNPYVLNKFGDNFIMKYSTAPRSLLFKIVNRNGQVVESITPYNIPERFWKGLFTYSCVDVGQTIVYVVKDIGGCLGVSMQTGDVVFHFKDARKECEFSYTGVTTDPDGNVYVGGTTTGTIVQVAPNKNKIRVIVQGVEGCRFIKFDSSVNILFVTQKGVNVVKTYRLL